MEDSLVDTAAMQTECKPRVAYRRFNDRAVRSFDLPFPTDHLPGSPGKISVLLERFLSQQELWHESDAILLPRDRPASRAGGIYEPGADDWDDPQFDSKAIEWCAGVGKKAVGESRE